jgi:SAM-dependent methyltransferase
MPTIVENVDRWEHHPWAQGGDEWSPAQCAEGTWVLWQRTILPRIYRFVPAETIVEIGPGFGRWTQFLRHLCRRLIVVDLSERCIQACQARFANDPNIEYIVNDGASLAMIADRSVDFIFSFDSLVHAEADAIGAYIAQAARKLRHGGGAFIHHSNLAAYRDRHGRIPNVVQPRNWRAESMSAQILRQQCAAAGLHCRSQELINWIGRRRDADKHRLDGRRIALTDCLSAVMNERSALPTRVVVNHQFVDEWRTSVQLVDVYTKRTTVETAAAPASFGRSVRTASQLARQFRLGQLFDAASHRVTEAAAHLSSTVASRIRGEVVRRLSRRA